MIYTSNVIDIVKVKDGAPGADGQTGKTLYTWIVYANADGVDSNNQLINPKDFSTSDSSNRAYMGIAYNKETTTESTTLTDYKWSRIKGEQGIQGNPGQDGVPGKDGQDGAPGKDGQDGQKYFIYINTNEIKRFYEKNDGRTFSPEVVEFYAYDYNNKKIDIDNTDFSIEVNVIPSGFDTVQIPSSYIIRNESDTKEYISHNINFTNLVKNNIFSFLRDIESIVYFTFLKGTEVLYTKAISCIWALSEDYAKFSITATTIQASVDNAGLKFGNDGLTISNSENGGIKIIHIDEYVKTQDTTAIAGKKYYSYNEATKEYTEISVSPGDSVSGYYEITTDSGQTVFEADTQGNVKIKGEINATSGKIGNINIVDGGLSYSKDDNIVFSLNTDGLIANAGKLGNLDLTGNLKLTNSGSITGYKSDGKTIGFSINGATGSIVANDITLGEAILSNYLRMGDNCWIFNPEAYSSANSQIINQSNWKSNSFINVNYDDNSVLKTAVAITSDGYIRLGTPNSNNIIELNGKEGSISNTNTLSNTYWKIDNNEAIFNNITAKGSIKCSVLEYGEIQAVGGIVLIRPSSIVKACFSDGTVNSLYRYQITLENSSQFEVGHNCQITLENGTKFIVKITANNNNIITVTSKTQINIDIVSATIVSFGTRTSLGDNNDTSSYGIGLNASNISSLVPERSLSLVNFYYNSATNTIEGQNKIILGYIPNVPNLYGDIADQYGLYADNVLVKGKLISGISDRTSGIDSLSTIDIPASIKPYFSDPGKIIFWAGANNNNIQLAPFWVDSNGNMYAGSGYFNGAIITESIVEAAEIRTAVITGNNQDDFALKIRNDGASPKAIRFYEVENGNETSYFELTKNQLLINSNVMRIGNNTTLTNSGIISPYFRTSTNESNSAIINSDEIGFRKSGFYGLKYNSDNSLTIEHGGPYIKFDNNIISTLKRLSVNSEFDLWNKVQFTKVEKDGTVIGFDIEIED